MKLFIHGGIFSFWIGMVLQLFFRQAQFGHESFSRKDLAEIPQTSYERVEVRFHQKRLGVAELTLSQKGKGGATNQLYSVRARAGFRFKGGMFDLSSQGYLVATPEGHPRRLNLTIFFSSAQEGETPPAGSLGRRTELSVRGAYRRDKFEVSFSQTDRLQEKVVIPFGENLSQWILSLPGFLERDASGVWEFSDFQFRRIPLLDDFSAYPLDYPSMDSLWSLERQDDGTRD